MTVESGEGAAQAVSEQDRTTVARQLGRLPRGLRAVAARDAAGDPTVVQTWPRLENGTPFPTLYYLTAPQLVAHASTLEADGLMRDMTQRLIEDADLAAHYRRAHESYLAERDALDSLGTEVTAGGMPDRVKCLHVHIAHALAKGRGVNPFGDECLDAIAGRWPQHRYLLG